MAQAANLSLTVGAATVAYTLTGVQNGDLPTMWEAGPADGTLNFADTISHKISSGSANRNLSIKATNKVVGTIDGNPAVIRVLSGDLKITFPRDSTTLERTKILDTAIGFLNSQKASLASAQAYY